MASIQEKVDAVVTEQPEKVSQTAYICYVASLVSVALSLLLWFIPSDDAEKKERGERLAIFVGLWPPTLAIFGKVIEDQARRDNSSR